MADFFYLVCQFLLLHLTTSTVSGYVHIEDHLQNVDVQEGERAKFICKIKTHPLDENRLRVQWKHNGEFLDVGQAGVETSSNQYIYKAERNRHALIVKSTRLKDTGVYTCIASVGLDTDMSSAHLLVKGPPAPPENVEIVGCTGNTAELRWDLGAENGAVVTRYILQFNTTDNPAQWHDYFEQFPTGTQRANIELSPWGTYTFRVKAVNEFGVSKPSAVTMRECTTPPDRPDTNPKKVRTRTDIKSMLVIEWNPMDRLYFNGPGFRYRVYWRRKGSLAWESSVVGDPQQTQLQQEVDDVYGLYEVQVKAENELGESHQPAFIYIGRSGEAEPLAVPKDFRLNPNYQTESTKAYFIWEAVNTTVTLIRGKFNGYKLRYWKSVEGRHKQKEVDFAISPSEPHGPDMRVSVADLPAYTALRAQVAVTNTHYTGPPSQTIDFFTAEGTPSIVRELHIEAYGVGYVLLKWLPPDQPNGVLQGYDIAYQQISGLQVGTLKGLSPQINNPSTLGARISGLKSDHQYRFYVWARTNAGRGHTAYTDIRTLRGKLPDPPRLRISELMNSSINVTWQADQPPDTHYLLELRHDGSEGWQTLDYIWNKSWVVLDKFDPMSDYEVRLLARNRLGDMSTSSILKFSNHRHGGSYYYRLDGRDTDRRNTAIRWRRTWWHLAGQLGLHLFFTLLATAASTVPH